MSLTRAIDKFAFFCYEPGDRRYISPMSSKDSKKPTGKKPTGERNAGRESVWDYPRPPRVEHSSEHIEVWVAGQRIADSTNTIRVLETSHPPTYYIPASDVAMDHLSVSPHRSMCEFKGEARYYDIAVRARAGGSGW